MPTELPKGYTGQIIALASAQSMPADIKLNMQVSLRRELKVSLSTSEYCCF